MAKRRQASVNQKAGSIQDRDINETRNTPVIPFIVCLRPFPHFGRKSRPDTRPPAAKSDIVEIKSLTFEKWKGQRRCLIQIKDFAHNPRCNYP
jgi:hypothetical protein